MEHLESASSIKTTQRRPKSNTAKRAILRRERRRQQDSRKRLSSEVRSTNRISLGFITELSLHLIISSPESKTDNFMPEQTPG